MYFDHIAAFKAPNCWTSIKGGAHTCFVDACNDSMKVHMSPAINRNSVIRHFESSGAIKICDEITFDFYTGLPHVYVAWVDEMFMWYYILLDINCTLIRLKNVVGHFDACHMECSLTSLWELRRNGLGFFIIDYLWYPIAWSCHMHDIRWCQVNEEVDTWLIREMGRDVFCVA